MARLAWALDQVLELVLASHDKHHCSVQPSRVRQVAGRLSKALDSAQGSVPESILEDRPPFASSVPGSVCIVATASAAFAGLAEASEGRHSSSGWLHPRCSLIRNGLRVARVHCVTARGQRTIAVGRRVLRRCDAGKAGNAKRQRHSKVPCPFHCVPPCSN